jgi:hypothetical protein
MPELSFVGGVQMSRRRELSGVGYRASSRAAAAYGADADSGPGWIGWHGHVDIGWWSSGEGRCGFSTAFRVTIIGAIAPRLAEHGSGLTLTPSQIGFAAFTQTLAWSVIFFFASAGASAAYLTVSEVFPLETRAMAIAFFYAFGTALGGITGPAIFGALIQSGRASTLFIGFALGPVLMVAFGIVESFWESRPRGGSSRTSRRPSRSRSPARTPTRSRSGGRCGSCAPHARRRRLPVAGLRM